MLTGANGGIGLAATLELARAGFDVVGTVRDAEKADEVRAAADEAGVTVRTALLDVTDDEACRDLVTAEKPWGLVNNAAFLQAGAVTETGDDEARAQLETVVLAPARLARLASEGMRAEGGGRIVNVSSIVAEVSVPLIGWYQAGKRALEGISDALRLELAPDGIDVVLVEPGAIRTGIWDGARDDLDEPSRYDAAEGRFRSVTCRLGPLMTSPEAVGRTIRRALTAERPKPRYLVGPDAHVLTALSRLAPASVTDAVTSWLLRLR